MFRFRPAPPPADLGELLARAEAMAGRSLATLAAGHDVPVPANPVRAKGWAGQLVEAELGASAGSLPAPDFEHLGVELKTIPVTADGRPRESTHVCTVPLAEATGLRWETSLVRRKLERVLWIPVLTPRGSGLGERVVGTPLLWSPDPGEEAALRADWEELMEMVSLGRADRLTAHHGACLQVRPKAASARAVGLGTDETGRRVPVNPRGFYLRASFTGEILRRHFLLPVPGGRR